MSWAWVSESVHRVEKAQSSWQWVWVLSDLEIWCRQWHFQTIAVTLFLKFDLSLVVPCRRRTSGKKLYCHDCSLQKWLYALAVIVIIRSGFFNFSIWEMIAWNGTFYINSKSQSMILRMVWTSCIMGSEALIRMLRWFTKIWRMEIMFSSTWFLKLRNNTCMYTSLDNLWKLNFSLKIVFYSGDILFLYDTMGTPSE